ncbi:MAG: hypothetical protein ACLP8Y_06805 [Thermoplasmata archaeon]
MTDPSTGPTPEKPRRGGSGISVRGVKVVAVVGAVAIILLLSVALVLPQLQPGGVCSGCGLPYLGFVEGNPVAGTCPGGGRVTTSGCLAGDYVYNLSIEGSIITFGEVLFHIDTATGTVYVASGNYSGFAILNATGSMAAHYQAESGVMNMTSGWDYANGVESSTPLTTMYNIVVDFGTINPHGQGYTFVAVWTDSYSGSTPIALP